MIHKKNDFYVRTVEEEAEEKRKYKLELCFRCPFYECELVKEYISNKSALAKNTSIDHIVPKVIRIDETAEDSSEESIVVAVPIKENDEIIDPDIGYIENELKNGCVMNNDLVQIECDSQWVAGGIGTDFQINIREHTKEIESEYDKWKPERPDRWEPKQAVYISAQTGQGKNTFIENTLLPYVRELNHKNRLDQKVLIISNRIALRLQIERRINSMNYIDSDQDLIYPYRGPHTKGPYEDITKVTSYQSLVKKADDLKYGQEQKASRYIFVVCDEAHFFTSDAMFNPETEKILQKIVYIFKDAIRIYMTATPYECLPHIKKHEEYVPKNTTGVFYHYKRDYSYLDTKYYTEFEELYDLIVKSVNEKKEKWLIFIDNKVKCEEVKKGLENYGATNKYPMKIEYKDIERGVPKITVVEKIFAVDTDKKRDKDYQDMVLDEKLNKDTFVLISTSVLDNGVNLTGIKNIVVSDMSQVKCLQMVGRARVEHEGDKKTLYIKRFNSDYVERRLSHLIKQQDGDYDNDMANISSGRNVYTNKKFYDKYYNDESEDWENAKHWFGRDEKEPQRVYPNEIARSLVDKRVALYEFILAEMRRNDEGQKVTGQKYLEYQLSWFGKKYDVENDITLADKDAKKKEFIEFLESRKGEKLFEDEQNQFSKNFTELHDKAFPRQDRNDERYYGINKIKKILNDLCIGYEAVNKQEKTPDGKNKTYWMIVKFDSGRLPFADVPPG